MQSQYKLLLKFLKTLSIDRIYISIKIELKWGTVECQRYLQSLLNSDRSERKGFDIETYLVLIQLAILHIQLHGTFNEPLMLVNPNVEKLSICP